jgi:two-component system chemotaxis sensor kinase CheA
MDDLLREFLTETSESIATLDVELVQLEQNPNNPGLIDNIFRLVHTIKGTCGFLGLPRLGSVAHAGENVLGKFRDGKLVVTPQAVTLILESLDRIKALLAALEQTEAEPAGDDSDLIARLDAMAEGKLVEDPAPAPAPSPAPAAAPAKSPAEGDFDPGLGRALKPGEVSLDELEAVFRATPAPAAVAPPPSGSLFDRLGGQTALDAAVDRFYDKVIADPLLKPFFDRIDMKGQRRKLASFLNTAFGGPGKYSGKALTSAHAPLVKRGLDDRHFDAVAGHLQSTLAELGVAQELIAEAMAIAASTRNDVLGRAAGEAPKAEPAKAEATAAKLAPKAAEAKAEGKGGDSSVASQSIRVSVDLLENLMTMVSELVLTRNQLLQMVRSLDNSEFTVPLQRLSHVTTELQEGVMKTRMQPIGNAWAKLPRIIRDLCVELGKKIDLQMIGAETELDRQVLELIKDPLTHMVRNSADHGLERPEERARAGKAETGKIILNAYHEGGHIIIEIKDDGRGLNTARIKQKVLENGLAGEAELEAMTPQQVHQFIFKAGFSTAQAVTSVSGRGVGMDVVRTNIEKIGGTIELKSEEGHGTAFTIKIPLTLAIVSALIVECAGERYAIPQISVVELVRVSADSELKIELINETPVLRLRNRLLPLVFLDETLKLREPAAGSRPAAAAGDLAQEADERFIVVTQVGSFSFGIVVDRVFDTEEIVVKPVAPILRDIDMFSGNTILGDGSVIMILDPNGIAATSGETALGDHAEAGSAEHVEARGGELVALLLFRAGGKEAKAVPLSLVARLEEIDVAQIESVDGRRVVQYRGHLMPLIPMQEGYQPRQEGRQPILVFTDGDRSMGLMVDEIVDIVESELKIELASADRGVLGSAIIVGNATEVIDVGSHLKRAYRDWFGSEKQQPFGADDQAKRILLVDDSPFFRNMLVPLLSVAGYSVTAAENADQALRLREQGRDFDLIISDIEMPGMSGFDFVREVKRGERWSGTPVVALSSHASRSDFDRGREAGFTDYVAKFDRDALLSTLSQTFAASGGAA